MGLTGLFGFPWAALAGFLLTALIFEITPGPNVAYLSMLAATQGRRIGMMGVIGVTLGLSVVGVAAMAGLSALLQGKPFLLHALRLAGAAYLFWLAWETWKGADPKAPSDKLEMTGPEAFIHGFILNLLNPKTLLFYAVVLPGFVPIGPQMVWHTMMLVVFTICLSTSYHTLLVMLAGAAQGHLVRSRRRHSLRRAMAVALAGVAVWFALRS